MTPQSVNQFGGFFTQGKKNDEADLILQDAFALEKAGVFAIVLEKIPAGTGESDLREIDDPDNWDRSRTLYGWTDLGYAGYVGDV